MWWGADSTYDTTLSDHTCGTETSLVEGHSRLTGASLANALAKVPQGAEEDSGDALEVGPDVLGGTYGQAGWWRLVWCHERCHKQECEPLRSAVSEAAREARASLLCLKKASKFSMWLSQDQRQPFALLTDWREVKPCIQAVSAHPPQNRPAFTVVLCEVQRHYERASAWAQSLPPRADPVHVCKDSRLLRLFLADLRDRVIEISGSVPALLSPKQAEDALEISSPKNYPPGILQQARGRNTASITAAAAADGGDVLWSVARVLRSVCAHHSPVQMEQMLREAMPDHYDE
jgi:hypothetical protein